MTDWPSVWYGAELKMHDNPELRTTVFEQLEAYRVLLETHPAIQQEYLEVFRQKRELGLINKRWTTSTSNPPRSCSC